MIVRLLFLLEYFFSHLLVFLILVSFSYFCVLSMHAGIVVAEEPDDRSFGLRISPLRVRPVLYPGETASTTIKIKNLNDNDQMVAVSAQNFAVVNEDYDYRFEYTEDTDWIRFADNSIVLRPDEELELPYSLAVPSTAPPGGYYFAILAATKSSAASAHLRETQRVASLVYLEVGGDVERRGDIASFDVPRLSFNNTVPITARPVNRGNTHFDSDIRVSVRGLAGDGSARLQGMVLPGTIRRLSGELQLPRLPGAYKVTARYSFDDANVQHVSRTVLYLPVWFLLLVAFVALAALIAIAKHRLRPKSN